MNKKTLKIVALISILSLIPLLNIETVSADSYTVLIDPGHGGKDNGSARNGCTEDSINLQIANEVRDYLQKEGIKVEMTREDDTYVSLSQRAIKSNNSDADLFVSIHQNASENSKANGVETYYMGESSKVLADSIHQNVIENTKSEDRNVRKGNLQVLRDNQKPAILLECGFISNNMERYKLGTKDYQEKLAKGVVEGIVDYLNQTNPSKPVANNNKSNNTGNYLTALNKVDVMSDRGKKFEVLGSLEKGEKVEIIDTKFDWHKIKYKDGYGYVSGVYVK